jgi:hypothetical protein
LREREREMGVLNPSPIFHICCSFPCGVFLSFHPFHAFTTTTTVATSQQVTWEMLVPRFVRYAREPGRFEEDKDPSDHNGCETVHIILRLLRDHLVKARTLPLDSNGNVVTAILKRGESSSSSSEQPRRVFNDTRMAQLQTVEVGELPSLQDRQEFVHKQHTLMKHGCVELTSRIMMAADTVEDGDLADEALAVRVLWALGVRVVGS